LPVRPSASGKSLITSGVKSRLRHSQCP
jgi:hypothetical protein